MIQRIIRVCQIVIALAFTGCVTNQNPSLEKEQQMNIAEIADSIADAQKINPANDYLLNPFSMLYEKNDMHVMLYFIGHPKYESIEATIVDTASPSIRVIITQHDKSQIDYINNQEKADKIRALGINRNTNFTQIEYSKTGNPGVPEVSLRFTTADNERIDFKIACVSRPSKKHAGLTNPEGHSRETSLPIMYRDVSALASDKSSVEISGIRYAIPVLVNVPIFFKGMKGYYSENFKMGIIRAGDSKIEVIQSPQNFAVGEKWIYRNDSGIKEYVISSIENNNIVIMNADEVIMGVLINGSIGITGINAVSKTNNGLMSIHFERPFFNNLYTNSETGFSIDLEDKKNLITGILKLRTGATYQEYRLIPQYPEWATDRKMHITATKKDNIVEWKSKME